MRDGDQASPGKMNRQGERINRKIHGGYGEFDEEP